VRGHRWRESAASLRRVWLARAYRSIFAATSDGCLCNTTLPDQQSIIHEKGVALGECIVRIGNSRLPANMGDEPQLRKRKFAPRSRQGCLTCRARRKRCDGQRPECQNCARLNLTCEWQAQRRVVAETSKTEDGLVEPPTLGSTVITSPKPPVDPWDALPKDEVAERKHLLRYYVEAFVPSVSVADTPSSFYTRLYIPWAFHCDGVLNAIIAMSSAQLARRTPTADRAQHLRSVSAKYQRKCYAFLAERVPEKGGPPRDAHQVIGIILLLVGLEALNGEKSTRWLSQMKCVRDILNLLSAQNSSIDTWEVDSLRRHFTYHNAMASLMAKVSKRETESLLESDLTLVAASSVLTVDPLMGIAYYSKFPHWRYEGLIH
jgi:transcriptional activator protein UGA3